MYDRKAFIACWQVTWSIFCSSVLLVHIVYFCSLFFSQFTLNLVEDNKISFCLLWGFFYRSDHKILVPVHGPNTIALIVIIVYMYFQKKQFLYVKSVLEKVSFIFDRHIIKEYQGDAFIRSPEWLGLSIAMGWRPVSFIACRHLLKNYLANLYQIWYVASAG